MAATREVLRYRCRTCSGTGLIDNQRATPCQSCGSRGWIAPSRGKEILCPTCKGFQSVVGRSQIPCADCDGNGHVVKLVEKTQIQKQRTVTCPKCRGERVVSVVVRVDSDDCERCGGSGVDFERARHGVPLSQTRCPDCKGGTRSAKARVDQDCPKCGGTGKCIETYCEEVVRVIN
jgi:DnaJ-class molecular chaperone